MKLHEYQSKQIFTKYGIPIPRGKVTNTAGEVKQIAEELGGKVVIKSQVLVGGRGKAGGIRLAKNSTEAENLATLILGMDIKGLPVRKVLVDEAVSITREIYLGITNDRSSQKPILIASASGGMDIEEVAQANPEKIYEATIDPLLGLRDYQTRDLSTAIDLPHEYWRLFTTIAQGLWLVYQDCDATLAEINPLVISADQRIMALDGKIVLDDNALYRHPDLVEMRDLDIETVEEIEARKYGLSYIALDGNIGCMVNGAGLAMATMDTIKLLGGNPKNFLDIGGGAGEEKVAAAFRIILSDKNVRSVLVNIFGGITRCDEVANGIISAYSDVKTKTPVVVRLAGTNASLGMEILKDAHFKIGETLMEAAKKAILLAKEK
jgi:succinyl-CoA synthetase beta subunit